MTEPELKELIREVIPELQRNVESQEYAPHVGQIKIEVNEQGWYFLYVWTGEQVLWYIGSTLPAALQCVARDLWHRYGKEI